MLRYDSWSALCTHESAKTSDHRSVTKKPQPSIGKPSQRNSTGNTISVKVPGCSDQEGLAAMAETFPHAKV